MTFTNDVRSTIVTRSITIASFYNSVPGGWVPFLNEFYLTLQNVKTGLSPLPLPGTEQQATSSRPETMLSAFLGGSFSIFLVVIICCSLFFILQRKKEAKGNSY